MFLYVKPTGAITLVKSDNTEEITTENVQNLLDSYGLEFASRLIDDLLRERKEIQNIISFPTDEDTLCANLQRYIEDEQIASYDMGFEDGQNEGYESGYDDAKNESEY